MKHIILLAGVALTGGAILTAQSAATVNAPSVDQILSLKRAGSPLNRRRQN